MTEELNVIRRGEYQGLTRVVTYREGDTKPTAHPWPTVNMTEPAGMRARVVTGREATLRLISIRNHGMSLLPPEILPSVPPESPLRCNCSQPSLPT